MTDFDELKQTKVHHWRGIIYRGASPLFLSTKKIKETMNKEQLIESMVAQVMEEFDFDYVHNVMVNLDLKWYIRGEEVVPTTYQIIKKAEKLLIDTANHYGEKEFYSCETDYLAASLNEGTLSLQFVLTEAFSYVEGFTKTED